MVIKELITRPGALRLTDRVLWCARIQLEHYMSRGGVIVVKSRYDVCFAACVCEGGTWLLFWIVFCHFERNEHILDCRKGADDWASTFHIS